MAKESQEGLTVKKENDFTEWFTQLMIKAELADYSDVSGCMVFRPLAYSIWENIVSAMDKELKKLGMQNTYFPLFIPEKSFSKLGEHIKGFAPEVAWVTQAGDTKLKEKLAVRPTSEAIMYPSFSKWIRSHRDLPLLLNQWNNVVRWEFNNPTPFFRGREFLWHEGHTAFATKKEAIKHGENVIKSTSKITEQLMAIPGIFGQKTEKEKFAGAVFTKKVHTILQNGRVIEGACFHYDGENFAKSYDIKFKDKDGETKYVHQNTHALTTRMLGTMLALHSDNEGLVIPPKMAPNKVAIIPLLFKGKEKEVLEKAKKIFTQLKKFNPILDDRDWLSAGRKFAEHELKGTPIRIEIGPKDIEKNVAIVKTRIENKKLTISIDKLKDEIPKLLEDMQNTLYENAKKILDNSTAKSEDEKETVKLIKNKKMVKVPLCNSEECESDLKAKTGIKTLFIDPENESTKNKKCIHCGKNADYWIYVGKTY